MRTWPVRAKAGQSSLRLTWRLRLHTAFRAISVRDHACNLAVALTRKAKGAAAGAH
jgi:hypothetical protein